MLQTARRKHKRTWTRAAIKAAVVARGRSLRWVSRNAGLSACACAQSLHSTTCPAGERALADFLKIPVRQLFPARYGEDGERRSDLPFKAPEPKNEEEIAA